MAASHFNISDNTAAMEMTAEPNVPKQNLFGARCCIRGPISCRNAAAGSCYNMSRIWLHNIMHESGPHCRVGSCQHFVFSTIMGSVDRGIVIIIS